MLTLRGELGVGSYSALVHLTQRLLWPLTHLADITALYNRAIAAVQRVFALLALPVAEHGNEPLALPASGEVQFDGVSFAYGTQQVLTDFSLTIAAGASVALVGATGSGKSTALKLLLRFHQPDRGVIRFDGIATRQLDPAAQIGRASGRERGGQ